MVIRYQFGLQPLQGLQALGISCKFIHFLLTATPTSGYYLHFAGKETEAQRGKMTCSRPHCSRRRRPPLPMFFPLPLQITQERRGEREREPLLYKAEPQKRYPFAFPCSPKARDFMRSVTSYQQVGGTRTQCLLPSHNAGFFWLVLSVLCLLLGACDLEAVTLTMETWP